MTRPTAYLSALWRQETMLATWPPDRSLQLGQIISRDGNGVVTVQTTIDELADEAREPLPPRREATHAAGIVQSHSGAKFSTDAHASADGTDLHIVFTRKGGFTLKADRGTVREFETLGPWRDLLKRLMDKTWWQNDWQLVTHVRDYQRITVVRAHESGQEVSIAASVPSEAVGGLGDVTAGAGVTSSSSATSHWAITSGATLGYEGLHVRKRWIRAHLVEPTELQHSQASSLTHDWIVELVNPDWNLDAED